MLNLPKSTEFNKRIPKKKFYEKLSINPEVKRAFIDQIKSITWRNKVAATTANINEGQRVKEIEVFEIALNDREIDEKVLRLLDQQIPYHIIFVLNEGNRFQMRTAYKEESNSSSKSFKVGSYYETAWTDLEDLRLELKGLNLDQAYESIVREIAGDRIVKIENESLGDSVARTKEILSLQAKIEKLQNKVRKEKQFNKKVELNRELKLLKTKLQTLENGKNEDGKL